MTNVSYDIKVNQEQVAAAEALFKFLGGNAKRATSVAINRAGPRIRTLSSSKIREQVNLKASYLNQRNDEGRQRLGFVRASSNRLVGRIQTPTRGLLLSRFSTDAQVRSDGIRWLRPPPAPARGIRVKVKPGRGTELVEGGNDTTGKPFYVVLRESRALGIAARLRGQGRKFKVFYGPSLSQVFDDVRDQVLPNASEIYSEEMLRAMSYVLRMQYPQE